jgi:hypothetical protein
MSLPKGHGLATRDEAITARTESRQHDQTGSPFPQILQAIVTAVNANGTYTVGVYGDDGVVIGQKQMLRPWPEEDLELDQKVWVVMQPGSRPVIFTGGGACHGVSIFEMGIYFDPGMS